METYEQLKYYYLSNIACGDISKTDEAALLAELEEIKTKIQKTSNCQLEKEQIQSVSKRKAAA